MRQKIPVLCYHYFGVDRSPQTGIKAEDRAYITPITEFEETLRLLLDDGYSFATLSGAANVDGKCCVLTIDDAHRSVLTLAAPILRRLAIPATLFVVPTWTEKDGYMSWEEIRELASHGWEIGSHGYTHRRLTTLGAPEVLQELANSQRELDARLDTSVSKKPIGLKPSLAVPMGGYSARIEKLARGTGYSYISTSQYGYWNGSINKAIPRIVLKEPYDSASAVMSLLRGWSSRGLELRCRSLVKSMRDTLIEWK